MALAECLHDAGQPVRFLMREDPGASQIMSQTPFPVRWLAPASSTRELGAAIQEELRGVTAGDGAPAWMVLDTYEAAAEQRGIATGGGALVLAIDDAGGLQEPVEIVVNPHLEADASWYPQLPGGKLLLGPAYALLRKEFSPESIDLVAEPRDESRQRLLITLGGSDRANYTARILEGLQDLPISQRKHLDVDVVLGPGYLHEETLATLVSRLPFRCRLHRRVTAMARLMRQAELAVTAGGTTLYQVAALGIPCLALAVAEQQLSNVEAFAKHGAVQSCGLAAELDFSQLAHEVNRLLGDAQTRQRMRTRGPALVHGQGPARIYQAMHQTSPVAVDHRRS